MSLMYTAIVGVAPRIVFGVGRGRRNSGRSCRTASSAVVADGTRSRSAEVSVLLEGIDAPLRIPLDSGAVAHAVSVSAEDARATQATMARTATRERCCCF